MAKYIKYMLELLEHGMIHVITLTFQEEFSRNGFSLLRPFLGPPGVCQEGHHGGEQQEYVQYFENTFDIYIYPNCSQGIQWDMYNNTWRYLQPLHGPPGVRQQGHHGDVQQEYDQYYENAIWASNYAIKTCDKSISEV